MHPSVAQHANSGDVPSTFQVRGFATGRASACVSAETKVVCAMNNNRNANNLNNNNLNANGNVNNVNVNNLNNN